MSGPAICDRYVEAILDDPKHFDAIEVDGACKRIASDGTEVSDVAEEHELPDIYSVFLHFVEGGLGCCGDFTYYGDALNYAMELAELHGWPVYACSAFAG